MTADLKPGQTVWLVAKTLTAPAVCFKGLSGVVTDVDTTSLYAIVTVPDHGAHRIHIDNLSRRDPNAGRARGVRTGGRERSGAWPDGFSEVTLW
jgi:hypothetical protein